MVLGRLRVPLRHLRPEAISRVITPHALAFDGFRWRVRAYCHIRELFLDFVIARILEVEATERLKVTRSRSDANNMLGSAHRLAILHDFANHCVASLEGRGSPVWFCGPQQAIVGQLTFFSCLVAFIPHGPAHAVRKLNSHWSRHEAEMNAFR